MRPVWPAAGLAIALLSLGDAPPDPTAETRAIAWRFLHQEIEQHDPAGAKARFYAADLIQHDPEVPADPAAEARFFAERASHAPATYLPIGQWQDTIDHVLVQGKYFAAQHHVIAGPADKGRVFFDLWRVENGRIVEHWDIIQPVSDRPLNANTMWRDIVPSRPPRSGEPAPETVIRAYLAAGIGAGDPARAAREMIAPRFVQHSPHIADGRDALIAYFAARAGSPPNPLDVVRHIVADGDLVLVWRHTVRANGEPRMYADLFRVQAGRIVEHWDVIQTIPPTSVNGVVMW